MEVALVIQLLLCTLPAVKGSSVMRAERNVFSHFSKQSVHSVIESGRTVSSDFSNQSMVILSSGKIQTHAPLRHRNQAQTLQMWTPGQDGTYAQNYQDTWVLALAERNGWPGTKSGQQSQGQGFFLDLGAFDGLYCSNTALLEKKLGWAGICVEPQPVDFDHRTCVTVARPLSDDVPDKTINFYGHGQVKHIGKRPEDSRDDYGSPFKTITIGEVLDCVNGSSVQKDVQAGGNCQGVQKHVYVPDFIHFASMDIEGMESAILQTFPWKKVEVGVWIVEQTKDSSRPHEKREASRRILREHGYMKAPVENPGVDEYWVQPKFWDDSLKTKAWRVHPAGSQGC